MALSPSDDKWLIAHLTDLCDQAEKGAYLTVSDFLDEREQSLLSRSFREGRLSVSLWMYGGAPECERKVACFYPDFLSENREELLMVQLRLIRVTALDQRFLPKELTHRDYLGALMGLGVKREKIGDIRIGEESAYVIVKEEIASFICEELTSVGKALVDTKVVAWTTLPAAESGTLSVISVSSFRLDQLVSRGFNLGRTDASKWIAAGLVFRNGEAIMQPDKTVMIGDKITLRRKGKIILKEDKGVSKSGRHQVLIEKYGK
ncbi:MAG: hypothetical protein IJM83_08930 [Firmicutes bacterium]|nr:hypothetical protein [Bacillota bacterium]